MAVRRAGDGRLMAGTHIEREILTGSKGWEHSLLPGPYARCMKSTSAAFGDPRFYWRSLTVYMAGHCQILIANILMQKYTESKAHWHCRLGMRILPCEMGHR